VRLLQKKVLLNGIVPAARQVHDRGSGACLCGQARLHAATRGCAAAAVDKLAAWLRAVLAHGCAACKVQAARRARQVRWTRQQAAAPEPGLTGGYLRLGDGRRRRDRRRRRHAPRRVGPQVAGVAVRCPGDVKQVGAVCKDDLVPPVPVGIAPLVARAVLPAGPTPSSAWLGAGPVCGPRHPSAEQRSPDAAKSMGL
jgi:hypothetical protein